MKLDRVRKPNNITPMARMLSVSSTNYLVTELAELLTMAPL